MRANEFIPAQVDEGWKKTLAATALGTGLGLAGVYPDHPQDSPPPVVPTVTKTWRNPFSLKMSDERKLLVDILVKEAESAKILGKELQHLVAQASHETTNFRHMVERGSKDAISSKYDKEYNPGMAKRLGNTEPGDGWKYRGRGYVHLTGRYNYRSAEKDLKIPLIDNPDLASKPDLAAKIAIWYWKTRVANKISDFEQATVKQVTKPINPGLKGLDSRQRAFQSLTPEPDR
jgi:predicted chitinase